MTDSKTKRANTRSNTSGRQRSRKAKAVPETKVARNLKRLLTLIPVLKANPGIKLAQLRKLSGYTSDKKLSEDLEQLLFFGTPPFTPSDYIDIYIEADRVFLEFPQGLDRPLALTPDEWTAVYNLIETEIHFYTRGRTQSRHLPAILARMGQVPMNIESGPFTRKRSLIIRAIDEDVQVEFRYQSLSAREAEIRNIDPWAVFANRGSLYCLGYCHLRRSPRIFHLERMTGIELLAQKQKARPATLRDHLANSFIFKQDASGFKAEIAYSNSVAGAIERMFGITARRPHDRKDWNRSAIRVSDSIWVRSALRAFGPDVVILSPEHLRDSFVSDLQRLKLPAPL
ncbi:MAG: WYL domain-containing protein [Leptospirales bacterium]|nr:WYL domain-containing protein [Leptospirales bacterium]